MNEDKRKMKGRAKELESHSDCVFTGAVKGIEKKMLPAESKRILRHKK